MSDSQTVDIICNERCQMRTSKGLPVPILDMSHWFYDHFCKSYEP